MLWLVSLCVFSDRRKLCIRQNLHFDVLATLAKTKSRRNGTGLDPTLYGIGFRNATRCIVHSGGTKLLYHHIYLTQCFRMGPDLCHVFHVCSIFTFCNFNYIMFVVAYFSLFHWVRCDRASRVNVPSTFMCFNITYLAESIYVFTFLGIMCRS